MPSADTIVSHLVRDIQRRRPDVARLLRPHLAEFWIIGSERATDEARIDAILRAGRATIAMALRTRPTQGSSITASRQRADVALLHQAWAVANNPNWPSWYRRRARATAYGIGMVIAAGLSGMAVPGGIDLYIWRSCGTRSYSGLCDEPLCRACRAHDRERERLRRIELRRKQEAQDQFVAGALGVAMFGLAGVLLAAVVNRG